MAEKNNATCSICGKEYYVCLSCKDKISLNPWLIHTCCSEHYKIYQIIRGFSTGIYTKDETKKQLKNVDLHDLNDFRPHIRLLIEEIINEPISENAIDEIKNVDISIDSTNNLNDSGFIEKTIIPRRKNYKK